MTTVHCKDLGEKEEYIHIYIYSHTHSKYEKVNKIRKIKRHERKPSSFIVMNGN